MKLFANVAIFETAQEIKQMSSHKHFKLGKVRIYQRTSKDIIEAFSWYGECFCAMSVEIFRCLWSFICLMTCWIPFIAIDMSKEKENHNENLPNA